MQPSRFLAASLIAVMATSRSAGAGPGPDVAPESPSSSTPAPPTAPVAGTARPPHLRFHGELSVFAGQLIHFTPFFAGSRTSFALGARWALGVHVRLPTVDVRVGATLETFWDGNTAHAYGVELQIDTQLLPSLRLGGRAALANSVGVHSDGVEFGQRGDSVLVSAGPRARLDWVVLGADLVAFAGDRSRSYGWQVTAGARTPAKVVLVAAAIGGVLLGLGAAVAGRAG